MKLVLPSEWASELSRMADQEEKELTQSAAVSVQALQAQISILTEKIARITDLFVEQDIERGEYLERKHALMSLKRSLEEQLLQLGQNAAGWLEPMRKWITEAQMLDEIAQSNDLPSRKSYLQEIFGSNLTLHSREAHGAPQNPWVFISQAKSNLPESDLNSTLAETVRFELTRP